MHKSVYFSAGIGRTGTFIVIDYLLRQAKAESHIDVFRTVTDMRYQRANFVQTDVSVYRSLPLTVTYLLHCICLHFNTICIRFMQWNKDPGWTTYVKITR